jgi:hypothetical protein
MNARQFVFLSTITILLTVTLTASAHHSVSAEFDASRRIMLTGTITKVSWLNPHTFFFVDVKDPKAGNVVNWACELGSPNMLLALGWTQTTLKVGMTVSFTGTLARDGSHKVIARNIVADGTKLTAWPSEHISQ